MTQPPGPPPPTQRGKPGGSESGQPQAGRRGPQGGALGLVSRLCAGPSGRFSAFPYPSPLLLHEYNQVALGTNRSMLRSFEGKCSAKSASHILLSPSPWDAVSKRQTTVMTAVSTLSQPERSEGLPGGSECAWPMVSGGGGGVQGPPHGEEDRGGAQMGQAQPGVRRQHGPQAPSSACVGTPPKLGMPRGGAGVTAWAVSSGMRVWWIQGWLRFRGWNRNLSRWGS